MITLQQAIEDQKDLAELCRPKNGNRHELFGPNDNYGMANVMKEYAGYPITEPIYATFPHGMYTRDKVLPATELEAGFGVHLNYPPMMQALWKKSAKGKKVTPFAAPIHYALKQFKNEVKKEDRKGTLFVPVHSTAKVDVLFDREAVVKELKGLPEEFHPITLCVHWADVEKGQHKVYQDLGFDVVCAGHITDPQFLYRWLHIASQFKLLAGVGVGSSLFYSILLGVPYMLTEEDIEYKFDDDFKPYHKEGKYYSPQGLKRLDAIKKLFSKPSTEITREQRDLVNLYTHKELVKSPEELNAFFKSLKDMHT